MEKYYKFYGSKNKSDGFRGKIGDQVPLHGQLIE